VLTEVRVIRKLKKIKAKNRASAISSLSFVSTDGKSPQLLPVFAHFSFIDNHNFLV